MRAGCVGREADTSGVAYDPRVIRAINAELNRAGAPPMVRRAAFEAGIVESGLRNLNYGDRDSLGPFQQRPSQGWGTPAQILNPDYAAHQFVTRAIREHATGKYRTAGQLAQAVQRSAYPDRYQEHIGEAKRLARASRGKRGRVRQVPRGRGVMPGVMRSQSAGLSDPGEAGDVSGLLASLLGGSGPQRQFMPVAPPSFAAAPPLPEGFRPSLPQPAAPAQGEEDRVGAALSLLSALGGVPPARGSDQGFGASIGPGIAERVHAKRERAKIMQTGHYPLGRRGKLIGVPHSGTHTLGNWQSDNAVDLRVPEGTPVYAATSGTITRAGPLGVSGSRFAGDRVEIDGKRSSWYGHLSRLTVREGERVKAGDLIGYSGSANGVPHLHFATKQGDPRRYLR